MRVLIRKIITVMYQMFLKRVKLKGVLKFYGKIEIEKDDFFEGANLMTEGSCLLSSHLGYASYLGHHSYIESAYVGRYTCIGPHVSTIRGQHPTKKFASIHPAFFSLQKQVGFTYVKEQKYQEYRYAKEGYNCVIGNDVWIGYGSLIMEGVTIGDGAIVAAGSMITQDVPPYAIVGGIPAKIIRYRFNNEQINFLKKLKWWDKDEVWIKEHAEQFEDIEELIKMVQSESVGENVNK